MPTRLRFKLNHAGMAELLREVGGPAVQAAAGPVAARAKADPHDDTHAYENSIHVEMTTAAALGINFRLSSDRPVAVVMASDWKSGILEAKYGILNRALGGG